MFSYFLIPWNMFWEKRKMFQGESASGKKKTVRKSLSRNSFSLSFLTKLSNNLWNINNIIFQNQIEISSTFTNVLVYDILHKWNWLKKQRESLKLLILHSNLGNTWYFLKPPIEKLNWDLLLIQSLILAFFLLSRIGVKSLFLVQINASK